MIDARKSGLKVKCKSDQQPCTYWCEAPLHRNFNHHRNDLRKKVNTCLELLLKEVRNVRMVKLKNCWDPTDPALVQNDKFMDAGLITYWKAVDASFHFNVECHELFLARSAVNNSITRTSATNEGRTIHHSIAKISVNNDVRTEDRVIARRLAKESHQDDDVQHFFRRHRDDRYHWQSHNFNSHSCRRDARFILPRLSC